VRREAGLFFGGGCLFFDFREGEVVDDGVEFDAVALFGETEFFECDFAEGIAGFVEVGFDCLEGGGVF